MSGNLALQGTSTRGFPPRSGLYQPSPGQPDRDRERLRSMSGSVSASASRAHDDAAYTAGAERWGVPYTPFDPGTRGAQVPVPPSRHQGIISGPWPLRDTIELGSLPGAVPCARLHARQMLWEWGLTPLSADTELLVSELVTNAVAASRSADPISPILLWLLADQTRVLILVWDASSQPPVPTENSEVNEDAESGRGLLLVQAMSREWDWYLSSGKGGKVVWALTDHESLASEELCLVRPAGPTGPHRGRRRKPASQREDHSPS
jgi:anti-sigma regulatory factor (Ser/Thr protein kinase)